MKQQEIDQLQSELEQFTGTTQYYRIDHKALLTDGTYHLAERAGAYWLMTVFASYLQELKLNDWFAVLRVDVCGDSAKVVIEDGNSYVLATQEIEFTDFPLRHITLYACWDGEHWVLMLPSEY